MIELLPNGTLTGVPGTGVSTTVQFGEKRIDGGTPVYQNFTSLDLTDGIAWAVSLYVPWSAGSTGLRGAYLDYSIDNGATWHVLGAESHASNLNTNAATVSPLQYQPNRNASSPPSVTLLRARVYQNTGSTINLAGSVLRAEQV